MSRPFSLAPMGTEDGWLRLVDARPGDFLQVEAIDAGGALGSRLAGMGIRKGVVLLLDAVPRRHGLLLLRVNGAKLAFGQSMASKIWVRRLEHQVEQFEKKTKT